MRFLAKKLLAAFGVSAVLAASASAQVYNESGDAGQTVGNAQAAGANPGSAGGLTRINGTFLSPNDADLYQFTLASAATITASTAPNTIGTVDTELFLFDGAGRAILANNDDPGGASARSTLTFNVTPGTYLLGLSVSANEPVDATNQLLFDPGTASTDQRGPNPNAGVLANFDNGGSADGTAFSASYAVDFAVVPEPGTLALLAVGGLLLGMCCIRRRAAWRAAVPVVLGAGLLGAGSLSAKQAIPPNLGNGLDKLVESALLLQQQGAAKVQGKAVPSSIRTRASVVQPKAVVGAYNGYATKEAAAFAALAITELNTGRVLVDITLDGRVPFATLLTSLPAAFPTLTIKSTDAKYRGVGIIEGYLSVAETAALAQTPGISAVLLGLRPVHHVGAVTAQGVHQHRVNQINQTYNSAAAANYTGADMSVGVLSDSYDQSVIEGGSTRAATDVTTGDLPGATNLTYPQPVIVLEDLANSTTTATDEGRGMCQIVHDVAPGARIGFATADSGEVGFANNIRALAGLTGFVKDAAIQQGFKGDVVCDDVSYLDEPIFQDGIVAQGVNDAVAAGVTYCSSAANNTGTDGYASVFRPVPNGSGLTAAAGNSALAGTNIDLTGVRPGLYAGGFHNFNPGGGLDVAQTVNTGSAAPFVFQWNDPYDVAAPTLGTQIFSGSGSSTGGSSMDFGPFAFTAGQAYIVTEAAVAGLPTDNFDGIVSIIDSNGQAIIDQDSGADETVIFFAPASGAYTVRVRPFATPAPVVGGVSVPTQGSYTLKVNVAVGTPRITQDFNILFFTTAGAFISSLASNNIANNRPIELASLSFTQSQVQMVITRSNVTAPANAANQFRYVFFGNGLTGIGPAEYGSPLTPVTFGHSAAAGANSVAAYSVFRPNIPEDFTSPGPVTIYFDANSNRLTTPQLRLKPDIAACDAVNNTFFPLGPTPGVGDSLSDPDIFPNFSGTSAASPHAAALAALVLQAHGGAGSLLPAQVKSLFQRTAFPHDLDPYSASGSARAGNGGKIAIIVNNDNYANSGTGLNNPNAFNVTYVGAGRLATLVFNPEGTAATGGNVTGGNSIASTPEQFLMPGSYKSTPGMVFSDTFLFGGSVGLAPGDVTHSLTHPAPAPSTSESWTLNLAFPNGNFTGGKVLRFNIARSQQQDSTSPQGTTTAQGSADLLGSGLFIPEDPNGTNILPGMTYSGTVVDGATTYPFSGRLTNRIGRGYSVLDGYGLINVEAAVSTQP